jgi:hypothetical protein
VPAVALTLRGTNLFDIYGLLGTVATFGFVTVYILVSAAAPLYLLSQGRLTLQAVGISALAIFAMGAALLGNLYPVPDAPYSYLPYLYALLIAIGFAWSTIWRARTPALIPAVLPSPVVLPNEE